MSDVLTENLLSSMKVRSMAPISQSTFDNDVLISIANEQMLLELVSDIMSVREDFFAAKKLITLKAGVSHYPIPKRAIGNGLKWVSFLEASGTQHPPLQRIDSSRRWEFQTAAGNPIAYDIQGDQIVVLPTPQASGIGSLAVEYYFKPNRLVATTSCAKITAVSSVSGTTTFTVDTDLSQTLTIGSAVDFLSAQSPFLLWADTVTVTNITATTIEVATIDVDDESQTVEPQVGDYICPNGYACIPMIPEEFHPVLAQYGANQLISSLGDMNKLSAGEARAARMIQKALKLIKNRVEATPKHVIRSTGLVKTFSGALR